MKWENIPLFPIGSVLKTAVVYNRSGTSEQGRMNSIITFVWWKHEKSEYSP
jgi:hypothetical protein